MEAFEKRQEPTQAQPAPQTKPTTTDGFKALRQKAEQGDARAQFQLGRSYLSGSGVKEDPAQAAQWCRKRRSGTGRTNGFGHGPTRASASDRTPVQAAAWFRKAAEQGHAHAQFFMGLHYH